MYAGCPTVPSSYHWLAFKNKPLEEQFDSLLGLINPRRACAARVTACLSVCVSVTLNLTCRMFVRLTNDTTYLTGNEGQKFRTVFSENAPLQSCLSVCVCVCVCVSVTLNLTCRMFVRLTNDTTYLTGNEGQKFRTVFSENTPLQS